MGHRVMVLSAQVVLIANHVVCDDSHTLNKKKTVEEQIKVTY